jgi:probable rRNA maturation factor
MAAGFRRRYAMHSPDSPIIDITIDADVDVPHRITEEAIASLTRHILRSEGHDGDWEMAVRFVDDLTMQEAHVEFMGIDEPTDIMTFPYEDEGFLPGNLDEPDEVAGGDLIISVDRAADNASAAGWEADQELFFLIAHGILHLLGWDDGTDQDRSRMLARQEQLLSEWNGSPEARH